MDYVLVRRIPGACVRLACAAVHFLKVSDPGCVEDFVDLEDINLFI